MFDRLLRNEALQISGAGFYRLDKDSATGFDIGSSAAFSYLGGVDDEEEERVVYNMEPHKAVGAGEIDRGQDEGTGYCYVENIDKERVVDEREGEGDFKARGDGAGGVFSRGQATERKGPTTGGTYFLYRSYTSDLTHNNRF